MKNQRTFVCLFFSDSLKPALSTAAMGQLAIIAQEKVRRESFFNLGQAV